MDESVDSILEHILKKLTELSETSVEMREKINALKIRWAQYDEEDQRHIKEL